MNRKHKQPTADQRYQIEAYLRSGMPKEFIAPELGINRVSLYRGFKRNSSKTGRCRAAFAEQLSIGRKERYGRNRKFTKDKQKTINAYLTKEQWPPKQIKGHCNDNHRNGLP